MNNILETNFLEQDWVKNQPEDFKNQLLEDFRMQNNGDIDYIDYLGTPMIYSKKDNLYYFCSDGKLEEVGDNYSENDLDIIGFEKFNLRFDDLGIELREYFSNKAKLENNVKINVEEIITNN